MKKSNYATISFFAAIIFASFAMFIPPRGIIDSSVLWFTAELLVFVSNILGFNLNVSKPINNFKSDKEDI